MAILSWIVFIASLLLTLASIWFTVFAVLAVMAGTYFGSMAQQGLDEPVNPATWRQALGHALLAGGLVTIGIDLFSHSMRRGSMSIAMPSPSPPDWIFLPGMMLLALAGLVTFYKPQPELLGE